jgi:S1-C subfamily serine protease
MRGKRVSTILLGVGLTATLAGFLAAHGAQPRASLASFVAAHRSSPREIARDAFASVLQLSLQDQTGRTICVGSGFFVGPGLVVTALHVLEGAVGGEAKRVGQDTRYPIAGVVAFDETHDLALLRVVGATAPTLAIDDADTIAVGDEVFAIGSAGGYEGTFSHGLVSGIRRAASMRLLQITAPMSRGSSGGPILNAQGRVVGIATALVEGGQNLNFAAPASALKPLLAELGSRAPATAGWPVVRARSDAPEGAVAARTAAKWVIQHDAR